MVPLIAAGIAGGAGLLGGMFTNQANAKAAREAAAFNEHMMKYNIDWQTDMSNTAYQRSMVDMQKAGLNPMLAFSQGGASTPSGGSANMPMAQMQDALGKGVSSALEARRLGKELDAVDSQTQLNEALKDTQKAQTKLNEANAVVASKNARLLDIEAPAAEASAKLRKKRDGIDEKLVELDATTLRGQNILGTLNSAKDLIAPFKHPKMNWGDKKPRGSMLIDKKGEVLREY